MGKPTIRIGYLVPEFPGQTHTFFWRELRALEKLGVEARLASTRRPPGPPAAHSWLEAARARTFYLFPPGFRAFLGTCSVLARSGPAGWKRCWKTVTEADAPSAKERLKLAALAFFGAELAWAARRDGWNHLHVHMCGDVANVALFAHLLAGLSYSITTHARLEEFGFNQRSKWRRASFGVVISDALLRELRQKVGGKFLPESLEIAPMGVDVELFRRRRPYEPWDGTGPCRVFSCGRLNPAKGHGELVRAVAELQQRGVDARLRIAGEDDSPSGSCRRDLERLVDESGLQGKVELLGGVGEEAVRHELEKAHLFVLASHHEGLGVVIMEAMAMEVPVVATRVGGVPELVRQGREGLLTEAKNPSRLAEAMLEVLRDPSSAQAMGRAGRARIVESFHSGRSAEAIWRGLRGER